MDISDIRKKIYLLEKQRQKLISYLLHPKDMLSGSLYSTYKKCGNQSCRCARGELHGPFNYLSKKVEAKTVLAFVKKADEKQVLEQAGHYRNYIRAMAKFNRLDKKIYESIKKIKEAKTKDYERQEKV